MRLSPDRRTRPRSCTYASASLKPLRHTTRPPPCPPASPSSAPPSAPPIAAPAQPCSGLTGLPPCKLQLRKCDSRLSSHQWRQITVIRNLKFQCISNFFETNDLCRALFVLILSIQYHHQQVAVFFRARPNFCKYLDGAQS